MTLAVIISLTHTQALAQQSNCNDIDQAEIVRIKEKISEASARLQEAQLELEKEKQSRTVLNKSSKTITKLAAASTVLTFVATALSFSATKDAGVGMRNLYINLIVVPALAVVTAISGLIAFLSRDSNTEVRIDIVEEHIKENRTQLNKLKSILENICNQ